MTPESSDPGVFSFPRKIDDFPKKPAIFSASEVCRSKGHLFKLNHRFRFLELL